MWFIFVEKSCDGKVKKYSKKIQSKSEVYKKIGGKKKMKILVTFLTVVITNICLAQQPSANEWEPISHPNGGYSVQHSYISPHSSSSESQRDDRKLPIIRDDVESSASAIISPITQDIDTLQEFNKHNFIDDVSAHLIEFKKQFKNSRSMTNSIKLLIKNKICTHIMCYVVM